MHLLVADALAVWRSIRSRAFQSGLPCEDCEPLDYYDPLPTIIYWVTVLVVQIVAVAFVIVAFRAWRRRGGWWRWPVLALSVLCLAGAILALVFLWNLY
jgi:hypothetical protein